MFLSTAFTCLYKRSQAHTSLDTNTLMHDCKVEKFSKTCGKLRTSRRFVVHIDAVPQQNLETSRLFHCGLGTGCSERPKLCRQISGSPRLIIKTNAQCAVRPSFLGRVRASPVVLTRPRAVARVLARVKDLYLLLRFHQCGLILSDQVISR